MTTRSYVILDAPHVPAVLYEIPQLTFDNPWQITLLMRLESKRLAVDKRETGR